ncbi:MAG: hypothetical protein WBX02_08305 [Terriglobales bacterium]
MLIIDLVCSRLADKSVLLGEEGHSGSDFFLIVADDRSQERNEFIHLAGILLTNDVCAKLTH